MTRKILIIGATSAIAQAVARRYAETAAHFVLCGRDAAKLASVAADLSARGAATVRVLVWDATDATRLTEVLNAAWAELGSVQLALVAHGSLPDQQLAARDLSYLAGQFRINAESTLLCLAALATRLSAQGEGLLAVIGSVAGDRGRASNYLYGAAKAATAAFASGLRAALQRDGVHVLTIKPGFVATPMTAALRLPGMLVATPESAAARIVRAIERRSNVVYVPHYWRFIMTIIRMLPEALFKRLRL